MKYNNEQFEVLRRAIDCLAPVIDVQNINPCVLHFTVFQQFSEGQTHNWIYETPNGYVRAHKLESLEGCKKVVDIDYPFELYPNGCNDLHIATAVKRAIFLKGIGAGPRIPVNQ